MSAFWRDPAGFTLGNESKTALVAPVDMARFRYTGTKIQISLSGQPYKDLALTAQDIPIDGAFPDGTGQELQARGSATTFKRLTHSGASGANLNLGGLLTIDAAEIKDRSIVLSAITSVPETSIKLTQYHTSPQPILMQFDRARGLVTGANPIQDNDVLGEIKFRGYRDGAFQNFGYVRAAWNLNDGGYIDVGSGTSTTPGSPGTTGARLTITQNIGLGLAGTNGYYAVVVDNVSNVVTGVGSMPTTATAGYLWIPQALGVLEAAPNPNKFGWKPVAFVGNDLYTFDGTRWRNLVSAQFTGEWRWSDLVSGAVGDGYLRLGATDYAAAVELIINNETNTGTDVSFVLDQMVPGDQIYFQDKDDATNWARYELTSVAVVVDDDYGFMVVNLGHNGSIANNQVITVRLISGGGGGGAGGGATDPGGVPTEVQYKQNATTFGGIANSSVTGANVRFGGVLSAEGPSKAFIINPTGTDLVVLLGESSTTTNPIIIDIQRSRGVSGAPEALVANDWVGKLTFSGWQGTGLVPMGYVQSRWHGDGVGELGNIVSLGAGAEGEARVAVQQKPGAGSVAAFAGTHWFQVQTAGFAISAGGAGALFHKVDGTYLGVLEINATGTPPVDLGKVLTVTDIGSGVLMPRWQPPTAVALRLDQIQDPTASKAFSMGLNTLSFSYAATTANEDNFIIQSADGAAGTGVVLLVRTGTASSKAPFRVATGGDAGPTVFGVNSVGKVGVGAIAPTFNTDASYNLNVFGNSRFGGGVRNEQVAAESLVVTKQSAGVDAPALLQFSRAGVALADLASDDIVGRIEFYGKIAGAYPLLGYLSTLHNTTLGGVITLGAGTGAGTQARLQVTQSAVAGSVEMRAGSYYIQVNTAGIAMVGGTTGSIYYKGDPTYLHVLDINPATDSGRVLTVAEDTAGSGIWLPRWKVLTATGAFPDGTTTELQSRLAAGGAFKAVAVSSVSGADITLGGLLKLNASGLNNQSIQLSALTGATTYMVLSRYDDADKLPNVIQFNRARGTVDVPAVLQDDDQIGELRFVGYVGTTPSFLWMGGLRASWNMTNGLTIETGAGLSRVTVLQNYGVQLASSGGYTLTVGTGGFSFSNGTRGAIFWQNSGGFFVPLAAGGAGQVLTAVEVVAGIREPQWASMAAGGANPDGDGSELQARNTTNSFKRITGSSATDGNIALAGNINLDSVGLAPEVASARVIKFFRINAGSADIAAGNEVGKIDFYGQRAGAPALCGYLRSYLDGVTPLVEMGQSEAARIAVSPGAAAMIAGAHFVQVQAGGIRLTGGLQGSIWFQEGAPGADVYKPLTIGANQTYLRSDSVRPGWSPLLIADLSGTLPIAKGGTGLSTPPTAGQLLIGKADGSYNLATLTQGPNISIGSGDGVITITGAASVPTNPGGSSPQIQFNNANVFGGITGSSVDGANIGLQGSLGLVATGAYHTIYLDRVNAGGTDIGADIVGEINFRGQRGGNQSQMGFVRGRYNATYGANIQVGATESAMLSVYPIAITMHLGTYYFQVQTDGYRIKGGAHGAIFYQSGPVDGEYFVPLAIQPGFLKNVGGTPDWELLTWADLSGVLPITQGGTGHGTAPTVAGQLLRAESTTEYRPATLIEGSGIDITNDSGSITIACTVVPGGGAFPVGGVNELQAKNDGTSFKALSGSIVSGSDLQMAGNLTINSAAGKTIFLYRTAEAAHGLEIGRVQFQAGAGMNDLGYLRSYYTTDFSLGAVVEIGHGDGLGKRIYVSSIGATMEIGSHFLQVLTTGVRLSGGALGSIYFQEQGPGYLIYSPLLIGSEGTFLKALVTGRPGWASITMTDLTGVLPIAKGGTGRGVTVTAGGELLIAKSDGSYNLARLIQGSNVNIANDVSAGTITISAASGPGATTPQGDNGELQFNNSSVFGGFDGSLVSGRDLTLGGELLVSDTAGHSLVFERTTDAANTELVGAVWFRRAGVTPTYYGFIRAYRDDDNGGFVCDMGASVARRLAFNSGGTAWDYDGRRILMSTSGISVSTGVNGGVFYQDGGGWLVGLPMTSSAGKFLKSSGTLPLWAGVTMTDVTGVVPIAQGGTGRSTPPTTGNLLIGKSDGTYNLTTLTQGGIISIVNDPSGTITISASGGPGATVPQGDNGELQFNNSSAFGGFDGSFVNGRNLTLGGDVLISDPGAHSIFFERTTDVLDDEHVGAIWFRRSGATPTYYGYLRLYRDIAAAPSPEFTLEMGTDLIGARRLYFNNIAATLAYDGQFIQLKSGSIHMSIGGAGMLLWQTGSSIQGLPIAGTNGQFLKSNGTIPGWAALTVDDVGGVLPITKGGTGLGTPPTIEGQLLRANAAFTGYAPATLVGTGTVSISNVAGTITIVGTGGSTTPPQGSATELQYRKADGTQFQPVTSSSVSGADITLGGYINLAASGAQRGYVRAYYDPTPTTGEGDVVEMVASDLSHIRVTSLKGVKMYEATGGLYFAVGQGGFYFSQGGPGMLWYTNSSNFFYPLGNGAIGSFLKSVGPSPNYPAWVDLDTSDIKTGILGTAFGGTGSNVPPGSGQLLIGGAGGQYTTAYLSQGQNIGISNGPGAITIGFSGVLPIALGGTNTSEAPTVGYLLRANTTAAYKPVALIQGPGIQIDNAVGGITISSLVSGSPPTGDDATLQAKSGGGFVMLQGSVVSGTTLTLAGALTLNTPLSVASGGTGANNSTTVVGQILRASTTTAYAPATLAGSAGIGINYLSGTITFTNLQPGGPGNLPGGTTGTPLQYRKSDGTAFEAVTGSSVAGAVITLGGNMLFSATDAYHNLYFDRVNSGTPEVVVDNIVGSIEFRGWRPTPLPAGLKTMGFVRGIYRGIGATLELGVSGTSFMQMSETYTSIYLGSHFIRLQTGGIRISGGVQGSIFYQSGLANEEIYTPLGIDTTGQKFLKSTGTRPDWVTIDATDIRGGTLPIARGGTGGTGTPAIGQIMRAASTLQYLPVSLEGQGTVSVNYDAPNNKIVFLGTGGSSTPPVGFGTELQYRKADGTIFQAVTSSSVNGANISLAGTLTLASGTENIVINQNKLQFNASGAERGNIQGYYDGTLLNTIQITVPDGSMLRIAERAVSLYEGTSGLYMAIGLHGSIPATYGFYFSLGTFGDLWYNHETTGFFTPLTISGNSGKFLKASGSPLRPTWANIAMTDLTGVLPVTSGGTGATTAPDAYLLRGNGTAYAPAELRAGAGIGISNNAGLITITNIADPGTGETVPGGANLSLQYNDNGVFAGIPGIRITNVNTPNLMISGGYLQLSAGWTEPPPSGGTIDMDQEFFISATKGSGTPSYVATRFVMRRYSTLATPTGINIVPTGRVYTDGPYIEFDRGRNSAANKLNVEHDDTTGHLIFSGWRDGALKQTAYVRSWWDGAGGGRLDLGAGDLNSNALITMLETASVSAITLYGSSNFYLSVNSAGYILNGGGVGTLWYSTGVGANAYLNPTAVPPTYNASFPQQSDRIAMWDSSASQIRWMTVGANLTIDGATNTLNAASGTGTTNPDGTGSELQYRNPSTGAFAAVGTSGVTAAGWVGIGTTTPAVRFNVVGDTALQSAGFIFQVQTAGFHFSGGGGGTGSLYYRNASGYFVPTIAPPVYTGSPTTQSQDRIAMWDASVSQIAWLTVGSTLAIDATNTLNTVGGSGPTLSGTDLQLAYRQNSTTINTISGTSWDGSTITLPGNVTIRSDTAVGFYIRLAYDASAAGPNIIFHRARGTLLGRAAVQAADWLGYVQWHAYYDSLSAPRLAAQQEVISQTAFTSTNASAYMKFSTIARDRTIAPMGRMILGAVRYLANDTLTELFTITYGAADHAAAAGEIHLTFVAKGFSGGVNQVQTYRRKIKFAISHNATNNSGTFSAIAESGAHYGVDSGGILAINHARNAQLHPGQSVDSEILADQTGWNQLVYKILYKVNWTTVYSITCFYHIIYAGDGVDLVIPTA